MSEQLLWNSSVYKYIDYLWKLVLSWTAYMYSLWHIHVTISFTSLQHSPASSCGRNIYTSHLSTHKHSEFKCVFCPICYTNVALFPTSFPVLSIHLFIYLLVYYSSGKMSKWRPCHSSGSDVQQQRRWQVIMGCKCLLCCYTSFATPFHCHLLPGSGKAWKD